MRTLVLTSSLLAPTYNQRMLRQVDYINEFPNMHAELCNDLPLYEVERKIIKDKFDCVFPAVVFNCAQADETQFSFNTALYQILLYHKQEYIGSDLYVQMLLNDKALTGHRSGMGLPGKIITRVLWENRKTTAIDTLGTIEWPVIVKPNTLSASMGITKESIAYSAEEAIVIIETQFKSFSTLTEVLLEQYLPNAREYTVSVTGNGSWSIACPTALEPVSGVYEIYSFENKRMAINERPIKYSTVADLHLLERLTENAKELARKFCLRDYCRFDFLVDEQQNIFLIDANTIPALGMNYMHAYTSTGVLKIEQILGLLLAVFSKRTGVPLPKQFLQSLPHALLTQLGF